MKNNYISKLIAGFFLLTLVGCGGPAEPSKYAEVAKCLTDKGVIMYGAYWCPHCANQKKIFGSDFQFIKYQECDPQGVGGDKAACLEAGVTQYPTWKFPGQGNVIGEQQVRDLAKLANCSEYLPEEDLKLIESEKSTLNEVNQPTATEAVVSQDKNTESTESSASNTQTTVTATEVPLEN